MTEDDLFAFARKRGDFRGGWMKSGVFPETVYIGWMRFSRSVLIYKSSEGYSLVIGAEIIPPIQDLDAFMALLPLVLE